MRVVCIPEGNSIAHVSRLLEIAKVLRTRGHECVFAGFGQSLDVVKQDGFELRPLPGLSIERIAEAVRTLNFDLLFGDSAEMDGFVDAELELYRTTRADLVLADHRFTARISAQLAGLPSVGVVNSHASNHSPRPMLMPFYRRDRGGSVLARSLGLLQVAVERRFYHRTLAGLHKLCVRRGVPVPYAYDIVSGNDLTLVPDHPDFTPLHRAPASFHLVGPLTWHNRLAQIPDFAAFAAFKRRIFVVLGTGGLEEMLPQLATLRDEETGYCVAAGNMASEVSAESLPPNVRLVRFVNGDLLLPHCHAEICHGGNGTVYQALQHGVPMVVIPTHNEQDYNARRVQQLGVGQRFPGKQLRTRFRDVIAAAHRLSNDPVATGRAREWKTKLANQAGAKRSADLIEELAVSRKNARG